MNAAMPTDSLSGKLALVTGAARGIGLEVGRQLGVLGAEVVMAARDTAKAEAAAGELRRQGLQAVALALDVTKAEDREAARDYLARNYGKLDILVNNAAVWLESANAATPPPQQASETSPQILRETFEANFFAPVFLTQALLPLLRRAPAARIVNVSSIRGSLAHQADPSSPVYPNKALAYDTSKTALNAFTVQLAEELRPTAIKVNAVHPGWVRTEMGSGQADLDVAEGARTVVAYAALAADGPSGGFFYFDQRLPWCAGHAYSMNPSRSST